MSRQKPERSTGICSVMPPGLMPVPCTLTPACRQAPSSSAMSAVRGGKNQPVGVTTLRPARTMRSSSAGLGSIGA